MDLAGIIAMMGSVGLSVFILSTAFFIVGKKANSFIPSELYYLQSIIGVSTYHLFLHHPIRFDLLMLAIVILFIFMLIIFPLRGISYQTKITKTNIVERLRKSMTFRSDGIYSINHQIHQMTTEEGIKILVRSTYRDKYREVYIVGGYHLKEIRLVKKRVLQALYPIVDREQQDKEHLGMIFLGLGLLTIFALLTYA